MPTLSVTKTYAANSVLASSSLDDIRQSIETFINVTKLDSDNINIAAISDSVGTGMSASGANAVAASRTRGVGTTVAAGGVGQSNNVGTLGVFGSSSATAVVVPNLTIDITTSGRPVFLGLNSTNISTATGGEVATSTNGVSAVAASAIIEFRRGATVIARQRFQVVSGSAATNVAVVLPSSAFWHVDAAAAGTYTYSVYCFNQDGTDNTDFKDCRLIAFEL